MKVCFLTHNLKEDNGAGVFSLKLIEAARAAGAEIVAYATEYSGKEFERPLPKGIKLLVSLPAIRRDIRRCSVVHALDGYPYGVIAMVAGMGLPARRIITAVGSGAVVALYKFPQSLLLKAAYRTAQRVTAISTFTKNEILKKVPGISIEVVGHGVDTERFLAASQSLLPYHYILSVGSLRWRKGYKFSLRAFAEVAKEFPGLHYVIVGKRYSEKEFTNLHSLIRELKLQDRVHLLEHVEREEELRALYRHAQAFCLLSQHAAHDFEGFGLVFLEAAAAGVPVVAGREGGVTEAVLDGKNGFLVDPQDTHGCAQALMRIIRDPALRERMSRESSAFAQRNAWKPKLNRYLSLYR